MTTLELVRPQARSAHVLDIDPAAETARIVEALRAQVRGTLRKRGLVLGLSGGVDSSVCAALAALAVGPGNVLGLCMPENDSDPESLAIGREVAGAFGIPVEVEDIGPALDVLGCYARRDAVVRRFEPGFGDGWGCKLSISDATTGGYAVTSLVVRSPGGETRRHRLPADAYRAIVAAANMKQRTRKQVEYHHADRLGYAVLGTPNRLEYDQGFFVRNGDGAADVKPIAHLYKGQVYALARHLGVPASVTARPPTTETWSLPQTQDEFYFALPWPGMDACMHALNHGMPAAEAARSAGLTETQVEAVWADIRSKRRATRHLHLPPLLVDPVREVDLTSAEEANP